MILFLTCTETLSFLFLTKYKIFVQACSKEQVRSLHELADTLEDGQREGQTDGKTDDREAIPMCQPASTGFTDQQIGWDCKKNLSTDLFGKAM